MSSLYALKPWYTRRLSRFVDAAVRRDLSPDLFTGAGVAGAVGAAGFVAAGWWLPALAALAVRLGGANLDGAVARARGVSRPWGFVLNELGDRVSDVVVLAGLAVLAARTGGWDGVGVLAVLVAALAATLPTFASLAAAGAGAVRRNGGPVGKTERCALVVLATAVPTWIVGVCAVVVVGSVVTAVVRLAAAHGELAGAAR